MSTLFWILVTGHVIGGASALVLFWVAVLSRKGGPTHRTWGGVFCDLLVVTGALAVAMSVTTLIDPFNHDRKIPDRQLVIGIFGWMMMYLGVLTVALAWSGRQAIRNKADPARNRRPFDVALQLATIATAVTCFWHGLELRQPLMLGLPAIGVASAVMTLWYAAQPRPSRMDMLNEHVKALVGAGISAYTAFLAFGSVRLVPEHVFNPAVWAAPTIVGMAIILHHQRKIALAAVGRWLPFTPARPRPGADGARPAG